MNNTTSSTFVESFHTLAKQANDNAHAKGFYENPSEDGTRFMLMVSEIGEAMEWMRKGNGPSDHIPTFTGVEEELADVIIRIMDYSTEKKLNLGAAVLAKMHFNASRPYKHGKTC